MTTIANVIVLKNVYCSGGHTMVPFLAFNENIWTFPKPEMLVAIFNVKNGVKTFRFKNMGISL